MTSRVVVVAMVAALVSIAGAPSALAQPQPTPTTTPFRTPNTDSCPHADSPPPPIDASEVPAPGTTAPPPLAVPDDPVGGPRLGECAVVTAPGAPAPPADISATAWVLADLDTGEVLAAKDPHGRYRPASTIKTLLAFVTLREIDTGRLTIDAPVIGTAEDARVEGSAVGIGAGGRYTIGQLLQGLVMASGNDAAHALARQLGGVDATVHKMNDAARELGATDTRVVTPSGLDGPGMSCSAYDMMLFFRAAMANPTFAELIATESVPFPGYPKDPANPDDQDHPGFTLANDNTLLYNYPGALGGKNGYTDDARQTFVGGAERGGRRLAVSLMDADVLPIRPWEQVARLLDQGFTLPRDISVGTLESTDPAFTRTAGARPVLPLASPPSDPSRNTDAPVANTGASERIDSVDDRTLRILVAVAAAAVIGALLLWARALGRRR